MLAVPCPAPTSDNARLSEASPTSALDTLLRSGAIGEREHAAGLAYGRLRLRFETACRAARRGGDGLSLHKSAWLDLKARHAALLEAAGFDRFLLDRVILDGEAPLGCEVGRVGEALGRVASFLAIQRTGVARESSIV